MANTLESIMRLTDDYTATMSKIIRSADEGAKATGNAEKGAKSLSETFRGFSSSSTLAQTGVGGLITRLTSLVSTVYLAKKAFDFLWESIQTASRQQIQLSTFSSLLGNNQLGADLNSFVAAYGRMSSLGRENAASATTSFLSYTRDIKQIQQLLDLTQRLALRNPEQGPEGAVFALKEVLAGQTMSLRNRFNMNGVSPETIENFYKKGDIQGAIDYLDKVFNQFGATQGVVEANFNSLSVQATRFKQNLMAAIGNESTGAAQNLAQTFQQLNADMDAGKFQPFFDLMSRGTSALASGIGWVAQNANTLAPVLVGVTSAILIYNSAMAIAGFVTTVTGTAMNAVAGNVIGVVTALGAVAAAAATYHSIMGNVSKDNEQAQSLADAAAQFSKDQKSAGASTSVPTTITNSDPIKVTGTVEIEKENLKYVFEAASAKFFANFSATQVNPAVNIQNQNVTQTTDLDEIDRYMGNMIAGRAAVSADGSY